MDKNKHSVVVDPLTGALIEKLAFLWPPNVKKSTDRIVLSCMEYISTRYRHKVGMRMGETDKYDIRSVIQRLLPTAHPVVFSRVMADKLNSILFAHHINIAHCILAADFKVGVLSASAQTANSENLTGLIAAYGVHPGKIEDIVDQLPQLQ